MKELYYNRQQVYEYAKKWAYSRNPKYYNFDAVGGDCTNFISQCIYAGSKVMNYQKEFGWYYINGNNKSPSWSGVEFLYKFLTQNKSIGPYGKDATVEETEIGDIAQLSFDGIKYSHSLVIVGKESSLDLNKIFISSHTEDNFYKSIGQYSFKKIRFIKIKGVRST